MAQHVSPWTNKCSLCSKKFQYTFALRQHYDAKHPDFNNNQLATLAYQELEKQNAILFNEKERIRGEKIRLEEELSHISEKYSKLETENKKLVKELNQLKGIVEKDVQADAEKDQILLVGSQAIYNRVKRKIREKVLDPYFIDEQVRLYQWRSDFFYDNFGYGWSDDDREPLWYTGCGSESQAFDTVPYQITQRFDEVVQKISLLRDGAVPVYFDCDERESQVNWLFESFANNEDHGLTYVVARMGQDSDMHLKDDLNIPFSHAAHMIVDKCSSGPKPLFHLAMKVVVSEELPLDELPKTLQVKAREGMYTWHGPTPRDLTPEGKLRYELLKVHYDVDESGRIRDCDRYGSIIKSLKDLKLNPVGKLV